MRRTQKKDARKNTRKQGYQTLAPLVNSLLSVDKEVKPICDIYACDDQSNGIFDTTTIIQSLKETTKESKEKEHAHHHKKATTT